MSRMQAGAIGLRRLRQTAGLSQEQLAERCHVSERTIRTLESGTAKRPHRDTLLAIAAALGMPAARAEAFVTSWRNPARTIAQLFGDRPPEQALLEELERQRAGIRELAVTGVITVGPDRRRRRMTVRRTFEVVDGTLEHFLHVFGLPTGQPSAELDPAECVFAELLDTIDVPRSGGRAFLLGLAEQVPAGDVCTLGYGVTYGAVDSDPAGPTDDESMFAVSSTLTMLSQEIRFDPTALPARAYRIRGDTVDGTQTGTVELPVSPSGVLCSVDLPALPGVRGIRWEWD